MGLILVGHLTGLALWWSGDGLIGVVSQDGHTISTGQLIGGRSVGQVFTCPRDGLARLEVRPGTYGSWSWGGLEFSLEPRPGPPPAPRTRIAPREGAPLRLRPVLELIQTLDIEDGRLTGLDFVARSGGSRQGVLVVVLSPREPGPWESHRDRVFRFELNRIGDYENLTIPLPEGLRDCSSYYLAWRLEAPEDAWLDLFWYQYPPPLIPQWIERATGRSDHMWFLEPAPENPGKRIASRIYTDDRGNHLVSKLRGELIVHPRRPPRLRSEKPLRRATGSTLLMSDNIYFPFDFTPIEDSAGVQYLVTLSAPGTGLTEAVTLWANYDQAPGRPLIMDGVPVRGSLSFRAYCKVPAEESRQELTGSIEQARTGIGPAGPLLIGLLLTQFLALTGLVILIRR